MKLCNRTTLIAVLLALVAPAFAAHSSIQPLVVFGAASLTDTLQRISAEYTKASGVDVKLSFASSAQLAKQIESGAAAEVFFSADQEWMDYLDGKGLIKKKSRANLLGNRLALIAPRDSKVSIELGPNAPLAAALGANGRLATGDPDSVPAGKYAKAALTSLGVWNALESRLARAENVRVALSYVARGEAPLGIVYATDVAVEPKVRLVGLFPENSHPPITYPVALTKASSSAAEGYLKFLRSKTAITIFEQARFTTLAAHPAMVKGCAGFAFDLSRELALFAGKASEIRAAPSAVKATVIESARAYRISLSDQSQVRFAHAPGKITVAEGSHAGIVKLAATKAQTIRVTLDQPVWVDLVTGGKVADSTRHTGSHDCSQVRKSVEFKVPSGAPLALQMSGSTEQVVTVVVSAL